MGENKLNTSRLQEQGQRGQSAGDLLDRAVFLHDAGRFSEAGPLKRELAERYQVEVLIRRPLWRARP